MSAVPATRTTTGPAVRPQLRVHVRPKPSIGSVVLNRFFAFSCIAIFAFFVSSLCGQVMVEKARREGIKALSRAVDARKEEASLRRRIDSLSSLSSIDDWARTHGFVSPESVALAKKETSVETPAQ